MSSEISELVRWGITTIVGILGVFIGRGWANQDRKRVTDKQTYDRLLQILPSGGSIAYLRVHDFGGSYQVGNLDQLDDFLSEMDKPDYIFIDKTLEKSRKELQERVRAFEDRLSTEAFPIGRSDKNSIPRREEFQDPTRHYQLRDELNKLAQIVCKSYDSVVKLGKERL